MFEGQRFAAAAVLDHLINAKRRFCVVQINSASNGRRYMGTSY